MGRARQRWRVFSERKESPVGELAQPVLTRRRLVAPAGAGGAAVRRGRMVSWSLDRLLDSGGLSVVFQPIVTLHPRGWRLHGLECLTRGPKDSNLERADALFEYVRGQGQVHVVDRACIGAALRDAAALSWAPALSVNVHASTLGDDPEFVPFLADLARLHSLALSRLTVEIVDHAGCRNWPGLLGTLRRLRRAGIGVALDEVGLGLSNYWMWLEARPDYLKIDRYLVRGAPADPRRQAILKSLADVGQALGARVVAEGVEDAEDLDMVTEAGIRLAQGYLFARPLPAAALVEGGPELEPDRWRWTRAATV
jgi:EAL domain-containing protein (putative c-di-GMP-specific phosphodiesterase class I)